MGNKKGKAPAFQFYVMDWLSDPQLRQASFQTKGIWIDMLCYMFRTNEKGKIEGTKTELCRLIGCTDNEINQFISDAERLNFCDCVQKRTKTYGECTSSVQETYIIYNRRMHEDYKASESERLRLKEYRENKKKKGCVQETYDKCNSKRTPYSSSSSSLKEINKENGSAITDTKSVESCNPFDVINANPGHYMNNAKADALVNRWRELVGRTRGGNSAKAAIHDLLESGTPWADLVASMENYATEMKSQGQAEKYRQSCEKFFREDDWEQYVDSGTANNAKHAQRIFQNLERIYYMKRFEAPLSKNQDELTKLLGDEKTTDIVISLYRKHELTDFLNSYEKVEAAIERVSV